MDHRKRIYTTALPNYIMGRAINRYMFTYDAHPLINQHKIEFTTLFFNKCLGFPLTINYRDIVIQSNKQFDYLCRHLPITQHHQEVSPDIF